MQEFILHNPSGKTTVRVGEHLTEALGRLEPSPVLLVDSNVLCQHHDLFDRYPCVTVQPGEKYKTMQSAERIYRELLNLEVDRSGRIVGVGGGLTTDLAGYVAATYMRGVAFGFVTTTLLGQVDASIGGKNGVNLDGYKNMIGTIRQPGFVWCDLGLLETLERKEYIAGISEVIKYGAILDGTFLEYLSGHMEELLALDKTVLEEVVVRSIRFKADIVGKDERESGLRRLLNFGHTIGHAIERDKKILHGQAVAVGMVMSAKLSANLGLLQPGHVDELQRLIASAGLPVEMSLDGDTIFENILKDKKRSGQEIHFVLLEAPGKAVVRLISLNELKPMLDDLCKHQ